MPAGIAHDGSRRSIGDEFDPRANSLNLLRLVLAAAVVCSHSMAVGGYRSEVLWGHGTIGDVAVDAFFAISGFLVTGSAERASVPRYLWQRALRIFPAFWACLAVTALGAVLLARTSAGAGVRYVAANFLLDMRQYGIAGTPSGVPYRGAWDGSLWTLRWEFSCYLLAAAAAAAGLLRSRWGAGGLWAAGWLAAVVATEGGMRAFSGGTVGEVLRLVPVFLAGAALWKLRDSIPDSALLAAASVIAAAGATFLPAPEVVSGPALAYAAVWMCCHLPGRSVGSRHDISYGAYVYGFPVAQALALQHAEHWGYIPFTAATLALTLALAWLSCVAVEQPALRMRRWQPRRRPAGRHAVKSRGSGRAAVPGIPQPRARQVG